MSVPVVRPTPVVRPARSFDMGEIETLARRPFAAAWSRQAYTDETERTDSIFLVADDGTVRGYALARVFQGEAKLLDLAVVEDGRGVGRALWSALGQAARDRGGRKITLEVSQMNSRAQRFYRCSGAKVVGRRPKFYNDGSDAILMDFLIV